VCTDDEMLQPTPLHLVSPLLDMGAAVPATRARLKSRLPFANVMTLTTPLMSDCSMLANKQPPHANKQPPHALRCVPEAQGSVDPGLHPTGGRSHQMPQTPECALPERTSQTGLHRCAPAAWLAAALYARPTACITANPTAEGGDTHTLVAGSTCTRKTDKLRLKQWAARTPSVMCSMAMNP
jgi:hypothetical protein